MMDFSKTNMNASATGKVSSNIIEQGLTAKGNGVMEAGVGNKDLKENLLKNDIVPITDEPKSESEAKPADSLLQKTKKGMKPY